MDRSLPSVTSSGENGGRNIGNEELEPHPELEPHNWIQLSVISRKQGNWFFLILILGWNEIIDKSNALNLSFLLLISSIPWSDISQKSFSLIQWRMFSLQLHIKQKNTSNHHHHVHYTTFYNTKTRDITKYLQLSG